VSRREKALWQGVRLKILSMIAFVGAEFLLHPVLTDLIPDLVQGYAIPLTGNAPYTINPCPRPPRMHHPR
jgi:hypothetical protein